MYYIYGRVRAIPTYRVYRLYDNNILKCQLRIIVASYHVCLLPIMWLYVKFAKSPSYSYNYIDLAIII